MTEIKDIIITYTNLSATLTLDSSRPPAPPSFSIFLRMMMVNCFLLPLFRQRSLPPRFSSATDDNTEIPSHITQKYRHLHRQLRYMHNVYKRSNGMLSVEREVSIRMCVFAAITGQVVDERQSTSSGRRWCYMLIFHLAVQQFTDRWQH